MLNVDVQYTYPETGEKRNPGPIVTFQYKENPSLIEVLQKNFPNVHIIPIDNAERKRRLYDNNVKFQRINLEDWDFGTIHTDPRFEKFNDVKDQDKIDAFEDVLKTEKCNEELQHIIFEALDNFSVEGDLEEILIHSIWIGSAIDSNTFDFKVVVRTGYYID